MSNRKGEPSGELFDECRRCKAKAITAFAESLRQQDRGCALTQARLFVLIFGGLVEQDKKQEDVRVEDILLNIVVPLIQYLSNYVLLILLLVLSVFHYSYAFCSSSLFW